MSKEEVILKKLRDKQKDYEIKYSESKTPVSYGRERELYEIICMVEEIIENQTKDERNIPT